MNRVENRTKQKTLQKLETNTGRGEGAAVTAFWVRYSFTVVLGGARRQGDIVYT